MASENEGDDPSYIDYETFLSPDFSPSEFANSLVLSTNNANDTPLDLSTPLSRVLFDIQEIDSHIDILTTKSAIPLVSYTKEQNEASSRIVGELDSQVKAVNDSYKQLEKEVIQKHAEADEVRRVASRLWETLKLGRAVGRCLQLGRQLEVQHAELTGSSTTAASASARKEDHRALVRCTQTLLSLRELTSSAKTPGSEGYGIDRVSTVRSVQIHVVEPAERSIRDTSERIIREFSVGTASTTATFAQAEETKARTTSALTALYLLSPTSLSKGEKWAPTLMIQTLEVYLRTALQSSIAGLSRALATLPSLERTLAEVAARCQNIVALEAVLDSTKVPVHPLLPVNALKPSIVSEKGTMLQALLAHLETGSLASYFWRTMASSLSTRVQEIMTRGGVSARTLKTNKNTVGDAIRECVVKGSQVPSAVASATKGKPKSGEATKANGFDREVAVMVGSVVGHLGR